MKNGPDKLRHTLTPRTGTSAGYVQDGVCVLWVFAQFLNRLGCWQHKQLDMTAPGFRFHFVHDRQGTRSRAD